MRAMATPVSPSEVLPLRVDHRREMNCQIVHDSIHRRAGWTKTFALALDDSSAGFGSVAIGGPWTGKPTIYEFYVAPAHRGSAFRLFEALLSASGARLMEIQSNDGLPAVMLHTYARDVSSEKIVFRDGATTTLPSNGAMLEQITSDEETQDAIRQRQGGTEWRLQMGDDTVATGGILFHYNEPYGDIYMDIDERFRRRGLGAFLVQELKRVAYGLGSTPCARCDRDNVASRMTLQKAGFVPYAHILNACIPTP
jgi:GNAT superfamily N-acetyltransferase